MGNVDAFLKSLINFDKDNVPEKNVETVEKVSCYHCLTIVSSQIPMLYVIVIVNGRAMHVSTLSM